MRVYALTWTGLSTPQKSRLADLKYKFLIIICLKVFIGEEFYLRRTKARPRGFIKKKGDFTAASFPINLLDATKVIHYFAQYKLFTNFDARYWQNSHIV